MTRFQEPAASKTRQRSSRIERRRARVRQRMLEVAKALVESRGVDAVTIEEITDAADVARRTFYHHFNSKHDALVPLARARTEKLNRRIDRLIEDVDDPAEVVSIALRHTLRGIPEDPLCAYFIFRSGLPHERLGEAIGASGSRDFERGVKRGRFTIADREVAECVVGGALIGLLSRRLHDKLTDTDLDEAVCYLLRLLGVPVDEAADIAHRPLPPLPEESGALGQRRRGAFSRGGNDVRHQDRETDKGTA